MVERVEKGAGELPGRISRPGGIESEVSEGRRVGAAGRSWAVARLSSWVHVVGRGGKLDGLQTRKLPTLEVWYWNSSRRLKLSPGWAEQGCD